MSCLACHVAAREIVLGTIDNSRSIVAWTIARVLVDDIHSIVAGLCGDCARAVDALAKTIELARNL